MYKEKTSSYVLLSLRNIIRIGILSKLRLRNWKSDEEGGKSIAAKAHQLSVVMIWGCGWVFYKHLSLFEYYWLQSKEKRETKRAHSSEIWFVVSMSLDTIIFEVWTGRPVNSKLGGQVWRPWRKAWHKWIWIFSTCKYTLFMRCNSFINLLNFHSQQVIYLKILLSTKFLRLNWQWMAENFLPSFWFLTSAQWTGFILFIYFAFLNSLPSLF